LGGNTVIDQVLKQAGPIEVFVVGDDRGLLQKGFLERFTPHSKLSAYIKAAALILLATLISYPLHFGITVVNVVMIYLAAVTISAIYWGRGPSLLASGLSVLVIDFLMIEPKLSFTVESSEYLITLLAFFLISLIVSNLAATIRIQVDSSRKRELRTSALYNLSRELSTAMDLEYIAEILVQQIMTTLGRDAILYYEMDGTLRHKGSASLPEHSGQWREIVSWVLEHHQAGGFGTATYSSERVLYLPIYTNGISRGVLGIWLKSEPDFISLDEKQMLEAYANLAGLAMERIQLMEQANKIHISKETEKLQSALLNSLSHDLRTPLSSVIGSLSTLKEVENNPGLSLNGDVRTELVNAGLDEAERMNRLIGNLLDMTRLESGAIHLKLSEGFISDVVASAIRRLNTQSSLVSIQPDIPADLPSIQMDITLIEQVVVNLLDNAIKYSAPGGLIQINAIQSDGKLHVSISDEGPGIPSDEIGLIFEKFYRGKSHDRTSGSGLGLAICKGFVEAHGGEITAQNNPGTGVTIHFSIPVGSDEENNHGNQ
jgi:two-component system sensor histidine kinase KdpD